ncbi:hypothetical protein CEXT_484851 [Caerostris extrusa]|uniref:Uncharacterized protein n=1 Tax=Caerostris extrusa TaxID=172846 RepID=A0AAV4MLT3_CAEEX|nr:hypothetical protein CEXT_484851 [Caerostris extrusa]
MNKKKEITFRPEAFGNPEFNSLPAWRALAAPAIIYSVTEEFPGCGRNGYSLHYPLLPPSRLDQPERENQSQREGSHFRLIYLNSWSHRLQFDLWDCHFV